MAAMLHTRNNTILFLWDKMFILMQNIFIVPAMQNLYTKPTMCSISFICLQKVTCIVYKQKQNRKQC